MSMTVEEALEVFNSGCNDIYKVQVATHTAIKALEEIQQYRAIGTVSEFRELKEKKYDCDIKHLFGECSYAETGCSDCIGKLKIKDALEKAKAKSPAYQGEHEKCPTCGSFCIGEYCIKCGQRILCD